MKTNRNISKPSFFFAPFFLSGKKKGGPCRPEALNLTKGFAMDMGTRMYDANHEGNTGRILGEGYAFGDQSFEDTIWRILAGKDTVTYDNEDGGAQTTKDEDGGRNINLDKSFADLSDDELIAAVARMQHEAHRDGVVNPADYAELANSVTSHTLIAIMMSEAYDEKYGINDEALIGDIKAFYAGQFRERIAKYDNSADYWKLVKNDDGNKYLTVEYLDSNGDVMSSVKPEGQDVSGIGWAASLGNVIGLDRAAELL